MKKRGRPCSHATLVATATKADISNRSIMQGDRRQYEESRMGCDALLRRQIETGHHWLSLAQVEQVRIDKGWHDWARKSAA